VHGDTPLFFFFSPPPHTLGRNSDVHRKSEGNTSKDGPRDSFVTGGGRETLKDEAWEHSICSTDNTSNGFRRLLTDQRGKAREIVEVMWLIEVGELCPSQLFAFLRSSSLCSFHRLDHQRACITLLSNSFAYENTSSPLMKTLAST
jgi:hypothetical protein